jgi:hypothetical protein
MQWYAFNMMMLSYNGCPLLECREIYLRPSYLPPYYNLEQPLRV